MNIYTLLEISSGISGMVIVSFSILMMDMEILGPPFLHFTAMDLDIYLQLFINYAAYFCFQKSKTSSLSRYVGALKVSFCVKVDFWKCLPL